MSTSAATPHGVIQGRRLAAVRQQHGDTVADVETKLRAIGASMSKDVLNKFEQGKRHRAGWQLALQLGIIYKVSPLVFLLPEDGDELVEVAPGYNVRARHLYDALVGSAPPPYPADRIAKAPRPADSSPEATERRRERGVLRRYHAQARHLAYLPYALADHRGARLDVPQGADTEGIREMIETITRASRREED